MRGAGRTQHFLVTDYKQHYKNERRYKLLIFAQENSNLISIIPLHLFLTHRQ